MKINSSSVEIVKSTESPGVPLAENLNWLLHLQVCSQENPAISFYPYHMLQSDYPEHLEQPHHFLENSLSSITDDYTTCGINEATTMVRG